MLAGVPGTGVGDGDAAGVGVGFGAPPPFEARTEVEPAPPQPVISNVNSVIETSETEIQFLCTAKSPRVRLKARPKARFRALSR